MVGYYWDSPTLEDTKIMSWKIARSVIVICSYELLHSLLLAMAATTGPFGLGNLLCIFALHKSFNFKILLLTSCFQ